MLEENPPAARHTGRLRRGLVALTILATTGQQALRHGADAAQVLSFLVQLLG
jgi:hypothetical protein